MQAALDELRRELGTQRVEMGELIVLGAGVKLAALRAEREDDDVLRRRLADRIRSREPVADLQSAAEVRAAGWTRR